MPFLSNKLKGYFAHPLKTFYKVNSQLMKKRFFQVVLRLYNVYGIQKFVKVKSYKRFRQGKQERVRSHFRRVRGR